MNSLNQGRPIVAVTFINVIIAVVVIVMLGFEGWIHVDPQTSAMSIYPYMQAPQPIFMLNQEGTLQINAIIKNGWLLAIEWSVDKTWVKYGLFETWFLKGLYSFLAVLGDMIFSWLTMKKPKDRHSED